MAASESAPVLRLAQIWQDLDQARFSVLRLGDLLNTTPAPTYMATCAPLPTLRGNITFLAGR
jgi:subfamily B ATP-binding cassette protein HlyB/CyaB